MNTITITTTLVTKTIDDKILKKPLKTIVSVEEITNKAIKAVFAGLGIKLRGKGKRNRLTGEVRYTTAVESVDRRLHRWDADLAKRAELHAASSSAIKEITSESSMIEKMLKFAELQEEAHKLRLSMEAEKARKIASGEIDATQPVIGYINKDFPTLRKSDAYC